MNINSENTLLTSTQVKNLNVIYPASRTSPQTIKFNNTVFPAPSGPIIIE